MTKYVKKPVEVEAFQWNGEPIQDYPEWVSKYIKDACWEDQAEKYELISPQNDGEVDITKDNLNQEIIDLCLDYTTQEEILNKLNELDLTAAICVKTN